jgi:hypothetical protein
MTPEDEALAHLQAILARPEFQYDQSSPWWSRLVSFILAPVFDAIGWLARTTLSAAIGREGWIGVAILILCVVLLAVGAAYLARSISLAIRGESKLRAVSGAERRERSDRLWHEAQGLAAAGQWAEAVRAAYLSALYALDEHAVLHVQSGLTNFEHATRLSRDHPELGGTFAELVRRYDRLRYGHDPVTAEAFTEVSALVERARAA